MDKMPCEVYSRIVGYLRPIANWNDGKKQEFVDRKPFAVKDACESGPALVESLARDKEVV